MTFVDSLLHKFDEVTDKIIDGVADVKLFARERSSSSSSENDGTVEQRPSRQQIR